MSRLGLAVVSFILGIVVTCFAFSLLGPANSVRAAQGPAIDIGSAEPVVPTLSIHINGGRTGGSIQPLDGIDCKACTIDAPAITYGGGEFELKDARVRPDVTLILKGAAANTYRLLLVLGVISRPPTNRKPFPPNTQVETFDIHPAERLVGFSLAGLAK
jgi:hypothetical protein